MIPGRSPLLTNTQWEVFIDPDEDMPDADKRAHRSRARKRIRDCLRDFAYLYPNLPQRDRELIFDELDAYRAHRAKEREMLATPNEGIDDERRMRRAVEEPSGEAEDGEELYEGLVSVLAFLYAGVDDREEFENMTEEAITYNRRVENLLPLTLEVSITVERERDREELLKRWEKGEIDRDELRDAIRADGTLVFDKVYGDSGE